MITHSSSLSFPDNDKLWLIGFRIDPDQDDADIYTLFIHGEKDSPLTIQGQIAFFARPELAVRALDLSEPNIKQLGPPPDKPDLICDVAGTLYLVTAEKRDTTSTILNLLNILFDMVDATQLSMPPDHKQVLYTFANHLTFHQEFTGFLSQHNINRSQVRDAILWCIGAIVAKAKFLRF